MKMVQGSGTVADYASYSPNCALGQYPFKVPVTALSDVQLYIDGAAAGDATLLYTCGTNAGTTVGVSYTGGSATDPNGGTYSVMKDFGGAAPDGSFVIAVDAGGATYFSPEYAIENTTCRSAPVSIQGCYGNLDPLLAWDCNGKYFGGGGDESLAYEHRALLRWAEVNLQSIRNTFKQGKTRSFRTEKEKIYQFTAEFIPEWYVEEIDAIFHRGEVYVAGVKYLVDSTAYEKIDECVKAWKPTVLLKSVCQTSFSCEQDPCTFIPGGPGGGDPGGGGGSGVPDPCCDPVVTSADAAII